MKKSKKVEELRAADSESEQLEALLDEENVVADTKSDHLKGLLDAVNNDQPLPASGTELILLEVDPHRAHAYWNIDPAQSDASLPLVLRVYDITDSGNSANADQAFDVEVQGLQGRWYLDFWRDDRTFVSEIGYRNPDASLKVIARSNEVQTPPSEPVDAHAAGGHTDHNGDPLLTDWPGDQVQDAAVEVVAEDSALADALEISAIDNPAALAEEISPVKEGPIKIEPLRILDAEFPISDWSKPLDELSVPAAPEETAVADEPDAVMAAGDASVAFGDEIMTGEQSEQDEGAAPEAAHSIDEDFPSAEELTASITENHAALQAFYDTAGPEVEHVDGGSEEPSPNNGDGYQSDSDESSQPEPPPAGLPPLEQVVGLSSMENANKDVLLEVNAELHIYGRSKPNTELTLYGQIVKTRPDGTFSVRRILPHGAVVLPLLYTKNDT